MKELIKDIGIAVIVVAITLQFFQTTEVVGSSMEPNFHEKDYLLLDKTAYQRHDPEIGDVVVFKSKLTGTNGKKELLIKRVCALPGDHVKITGGKVYINDKEQDESFTKDGTTTGEIDVTVPDGCVFCMGDNRADSVDSRFESVGFVKIDKIKGKVIFRFLPFKSFGRVSKVGDAMKAK